MARKKLMLLGLVLVATLMVSTLLVNAQVTDYGAGEAETTKAQRLSMGALSLGCVNRIQVRNSAANAQNGRPAVDAVLLEDLDVETFDEALIEGYVLEYEGLPDEEKHRGRCIWVVVAKGYSWNSDPSTDAVEARIPMAMRFGARPVMDTGDGILFEVPRGVVGQEGERHEFRGYGWVRKDDGVFYMKLEGEGVRLRVIGKVYPRPDAAADCVRRLRFHPVVMKGKMSLEGEEYQFALKGRAFRLCTCACEALAKTDEKAEPTSTS